MNDEHDNSPSESVRTGSPGYWECVKIALWRATQGRTDHEKALGIERLGHLRAHVEVVRAAACAKSAQLRSVAALALGRFGLPQDQPLLERLTDDANNFVRTGACQGLGLGGYASSLELLMGIVQNAGEMREVRTRAVVAAARVVRGLPDAARREQMEEQVLQVVAALHRQGIVRFAEHCMTLGALASPRAAQRLQELADEAFARGLLEPRDERRLIDALGCIPLSEQMVHSLIGALGKLTGGRARAVQLLAQHPREDARATLEALLAERDPKLVGACLLALHAIGLPASLPELARALQCNLVTAAQALCRLQGERGLEVLEYLGQQGPEALRPLAMQRGKRLQRLPELPPPADNQDSSAIAASLACA